MAWTTMYLIGRWITLELECVSGAGAWTGTSETCFPGNPPGDGATRPYKTCYSSSTSTSSSESESESSLENKNWKILTYQEQRQVLQQLQLKHNHKNKKKTWVKPRGKNRELKRQKNSLLQIEIEGMLTPQTCGRERAFVMLILTPKSAPLLKASQRQPTCPFATFFSPAQQFPSGFLTLLPASTNVRQSARFIRALLQSMATGAPTGTAPWTAIHALNMHTMNNHEVLLQAMSCYVFFFFQINERMKEKDGE